MAEKREDRQGRALPRVLALDGVAEAGIEVLKSIAEVEIRKTISNEELQKILPNFDALIVRSATTVTESLIDHGKKLKVIGRAGVGVDNICLNAATARGIYVVNSPQGNTIAAAELALSFMLSLARRVSLADQSLSRGEWERSRFQGSQIHGKTIGIVGLGQVGSYIAHVCSSMEMEILSFDPFVNQAKAKSLGVKMVSLEHLLANSDIVTLHVPLIDSTKNLIRDETLALMKPHALLINTSRGGVVDEAAVAAAVLEGRLGGVALDVFGIEKPFDPTNPLLIAKNKGANLMLTPHIGASTKEAQINVSIDVAQQVKHILQGELPKSAVNLPSVRFSDVVKAARYIKHAEILGRLVSQLLCGALEGLQLEVSGELESGQLDVLLLAAAQGVLATRCEHRVNFVNVRQIAAEHQIALSASKAYEARSSSLYLEVSVHCSNGSATVGGCSTSEETLILRRFRDMPISFCLPPITQLSPQQQHRQRDTPPAAAAAAAAAEGKAQEADASAGRKQDAIEAAERPIYLFYTTHVDKPGVLASILSLLSLGGINVANCHLGRGCCSKETLAAEGRQASPREALGMCIYHTDSEIPDALLKQIKGLSCVTEACRFATPTTLGQTKCV